MPDGPVSPVQSSPAAAGGAPRLLPPVPPRTVRWRQLMLNTGGLVVALLILWLIGLTVEPHSYADRLLLPGIILLIGAFAGRWSKWCGQPRLMGPLVIGVLIGPQVLGLVTTDQRDEDLALVKGLAIGLIAMMAGAEIRLAWLRSRLASLMTNVGVQSLLLPPILMGLILLLEWFALPYGVLPFIAEAESQGTPGWLVALLVGCIVLANSPTVVVSVIKEEGAKGPLSSVAMGVSVVKDAVVILLFTILVPLIAVLSATSQPDDGSTSLGSLLVVSGAETIGKIVVSLAIGAVLGMGLAWYTERSDHRLPWLVVGLALAVVAMAELLHLKPLFCLLATGFAAENLWFGKRENRYGQTITGADAGRGRTGRGTHRLEEALQRVAEPVFIFFFLEAGLEVDLTGLATAWLGILVVSATRMGLLRGTCGLGSWLAGDEPVLRRHLWTAMVPQAGISILLVALIAEQFGGDDGNGWGTTLQGIALAMIAIDTLVGPILFARALRKAGELPEANANQPAVAN